MRLFNKNKSQASIDRLTSSRSSSPDPYGTGVAGTQAGGAHFQAHRDQGPERFNPPPPLSQPQSVESAQYQDSQVHSHPAHVISRSSAEAPGYVDSARRPSVPITVVPPVSSGSIPPQLQGAGPVPGQTQFGQSKQVHVHTEKEHKRSKRSIFGFSSSKDRDKENSPVEKEKKGIGRSGSVHLLRKNQLGQQPLDSQGVNQQQQSPNYIRHSAYFGRSDISRENLPEDPSHYEHYHNPTERQHDSPLSQYRESPDHPDNDPHFSPQREQYQPYHQPEHPNTSDQYLPYQGQGRPSGIILDQHQALRPPSQSSLGPPSPLLPAHQQDSRPSTAATSRYSAQSVGPAQQQQPQQQPHQPQQQMARGDPPNGGMRQQMRDPRDDHGYQQDPRARMSQQMGEQGRNTPPPRSRDDHGDYNTLLQKHEELQAKYSKVKRYYFEREAQVTQLQNTVANQRLSMSKTSLDDAQYSSRFERLSGAINNLSFNIRKDWKNVPPWLRPVCNQEAHATGTKEMTAVGRACITRWLYETVFQQVFHPGIERSVSSNLKHIEQNLRRQGQTGLVYTDEQRDDLLTKITTWRLTTIEGLQDQLGSKFATQYQENLVGSLTVDLTNSLKANLNDPPPPGLQESVTTIISQAISICANIPMESRDICIEYFMPGTPINETYMKLETAMTPLSNPGLDERAMGALGGGTQQASPDEDDDEEDRERDVEAEIREATKAAQQANAGAGGNGSVNSMPTSGSQTTMKSGEKRDTSRGGAKEAQKSSFLGAFVGKKPPPSQSRQGSQRERTSESASQSEIASVRPVRGESGDTAEERSVMSASEQERERQQQVQGMPPLVLGEGKIRFAVFLAVEVRGKMLKEATPMVEGSAGAGTAAGGTKSSINVLYKAPVYEL